MLTKSEEQIIMRFAINKLLIHFTHPTHTFYTSPYLRLYSRPPIRTKKADSVHAKMRARSTQKKSQGKGTNRQTDKQTDGHCNYQTESALGRFGENRRRKIQRDLAEQKIQVSLGGRCNCLFWPRDKMGQQQCLDQTDWLLEEAVNIRLSLCNERHS